MAGGEVLRVCALSVASRPWINLGAARASLAPRWRMRRREYGGERPNHSTSRRVRPWLQDAADNSQGTNFVLATSQAPEITSPRGLTGEAEVEDVCTSENLCVSEVLVLG